MKFARHIPFVEHLGFELLEWEGGQARIALDLREELTNSWAVVHGGVTMTLLDVAMAHAARSPNQPGHPDSSGVVTIEMKTSFVRPGLGILCVDTNPWVTGAETCELVLALDALGDRERALTLLGDMQHLRAEEGKYWTGYVYPDDVNWPAEHTTYTAAAVVLAVDALSMTTPGSDIFRGSSLPDGFAEIGLECGCETADSPARVS